MIVHLMYSPPVSSIQYSYGLDEEGERMTAPLTATPPDRAQDYAAWLRWRGCLRKQWLPSEFVARNWLTLLRLHYGDDYDQTINAYDCPHCDGWHLGHDGVAPDRALL